MRPPEEVLKELQQTIEESKVAKRELNEARAATLDVLKAQRKHVTETIEREVQAQVTELERRVRSELESAARQVIDQFAERLRQAVGPG